MVLMMPPGDLELVDRRKGLLNRSDFIVMALRKALAGKAEVPSGLTDGRGQPAEVPAKRVVKVDAEPTPKEAPTPVKPGKRNIRWTKEGPVWE